MDPMGTYIDGDFLLLFAGGYLEDHPPGLVSG